MTAKKKAPAPAVESTAEANTTNQKIGVPKVSHTNRNQPTLAERNLHLAREMALTFRQLQERLDLLREVMA